MKKPSKHTTPTKPKQVAEAPQPIAPQQTPNMEVHHHPHMHHEKKWKEYLFQFFMLFLAVFCGFLAEYQLEHIIEKKREKDYMRLLVEDLETDTALLHRQIPKMRRNIRGLDSLIDQTYLVLEGKGDTRLMYYYYHHYCRNIFNIPLSQRAINQLKSSGNMRLIHDKESATIVSNLESGFAALERATGFYRTRQEDPSEFGLKIFDFKQYEIANGKLGDGGLTEDEGFLRMSAQPPLNTTDHAYLKEFAARVGYFRNSFNNYIDNFEQAIPGLESDITTLKKNYKME